MRTFFAKTNPAFKRAQLIPMNHTALPPAAGGAARPFSECTPPPSGLRLPMTELGVCASGVSQGFVPPAARSLN